MPYKKDPYAILRSKGIPLTDAQLKRLSPREAWAIICTMPTPKPRTKTPTRPHQTVCFSGFSRQRKMELMDLAEARGWSTIQRPGVSMSHFCHGEKPGPAKLEAAQKLKATLLTEEEFLKLLECVEEIPERGSKLMRPYLQQASRAVDDGEEGWMNKVGYVFSDPKVHRAVLKLMQNLPEILRWLDEILEVLGKKKRRK